MDIYFIAGIHGVGKGTLCKMLSSHLNLDFYSCSDIIKANSKYVEKSKGVKDAKENQSSLLMGISKLKCNKVALDGHFCLLNSMGGIVELDYDVFDCINPKKVVTVTCDANEVSNRLIHRDGTSPDVALLDEFQQKELKRSIEFSSSRNLPHFTYCSGDEIDTLIEWIKAD
ncbi:ATP-binding protein [Shewanella sp. YIC-542]|uniref:ATP-binding protein n=1 Tax=Shewanella mytili TaxID=3377111 RepID=UPI00398F343F